MKRNRQQMNLPQRWLGCPKIGEAVNNMFVPFKTPLDTQYDNQMDRDQQFHLSHFLDAETTSNVKMIINLTKTDRYYDADLLKSKGIHFERIQCEGHNGPPTKDQADTFVELCSNFLEDYNDAQIGVHCTHGFNRTGFMIVSYLMLNFDVELDAAVELFAEARPPGIYKQDYLDELMVRFDFDGKLEAPTYPKWSSESPKVTNNRTGFSLSDDDDDEEFEKTSKRRKTDFNSLKRKERQSFVKVKEPAFMAGVGGVSVVNDEVVIEETQQQVRDLLKSTKRHFPGSHPVSMTMQNITYLIENHYMVSWKADGTRYIMLIVDQDMVYMFDRDNCVYKVDNINFLKNKTEYHSNTLLDGEMVIDTYENRKFPRFLIYDVMNLSGNYVGDRPFAERLNIIKKYIIDPRNNNVTPEMKQQESFGVRMKDFWHIEKTKTLWEGNFRKQLCHEMDGLIFQPAGPKDAYVLGRSTTILKWKPAELNSIDFKLKCSYEKEKDLIPRYVGYLYVTGKEEAFSKIEKIKKDLREKYDNKIVECTLNLKTSQWQIIRERTDKSQPNHISTAQSILDSIHQPVHITHVYKAIHRRMNPK